MNFLDLPDCMIEQVLEYLSYDEIAKKRIVCKKIDTICHSLLNRGFMKMMKRHSANLKAIKSQLPRRESERRNHPLAKHSDILTCIETRISMLSMTYSKYIDMDLCCFIPGKVIDEVLNILKLVENTTKPLRAHEVLQELRDISSMAIEHFDENIAHRIKRIIGHHHSGKSSYPSPGFVQNEVVLPCDVNGEKLILPTLTPVVPIINHQTPSHNVVCSASRQNDMAILKLAQKSNKIRLAVNKMVHVLHSYKHGMRNVRSQLIRQNAEIKELKRRLEETEVKNRELAANINQIKCDTGAPANASSSTEVSPLKNRNIKPRSATIILKRVLSETDIRNLPSTSSNDAAGAVSDAKKIKLLE